MAAIYESLDHAAPRAATQGSACRQCGRCCDLEAYGHRLFLTTPEWVFFLNGLGDRPIRPMQSGRCPYNEGSLCAVYPIRFAGCRVFGCGLDTQTQSEMTELALVRLKAVCVQHDLPYRYVDLASAINGRLSDIGRWVKGPRTEAHAGRCT